MRYAGRLRCLALILATGGAVLLPAFTAWADTLKIGILTDFGGPYSDISGQGVVEAARMAIEDMRNSLPGWTIEITTADPQNQPDVGVAIARRWFDEDHVDVIAGIPNSAIALAVQKLASDRQRIHLITGAGSSELTGTACSAFAAQWHDDNYMQSSAAVHLMVPRGGKTWFFITADYAFGHTLEAVATGLLRQAGGRSVGHALHPLGTADFASYLLMAQSSGAQVIALANGGSDLINTVKQAHEFQISGSGQTLLPLGMFITDVHSLGLQTAQGLVFATGFYWDLNNETRTWSQRFFDRMGRMPTKEHAEAYSAIRHYLRAVASVKSKDSVAVMARMHATPVDDFYAPGGVVREDGRLVHQVLVVQVKAPADSQRPWDYYKVLGTIPADQAVQPLAESQCPLVKH